MDVTALSRVAGIVDRAYDRDFDNIDRSLRDLEQCVTDLRELVNAAIDVGASDSWQVVAKRDAWVPGMNELYPLAVRFQKLNEAVARFQGTADKRRVITVIASEDEDE